MTKSKIAAGLVAGKRAAADGQRVMPGLYPCELPPRRSSMALRSVLRPLPALCRDRRGGVLGAGWYNADELVDLMWLAEGEYMTRQPGSESSIQWLLERVDTLDASLAVSDQCC